MARTDELEQLKLHLGINDTNEDDLLLMLLDSAAKAVTRRLFPFGGFIPDEVEKYSDKTVDIALYKYNRRGGEGEMSRSEYGMSVSYESGDIPLSLLRDITPYAGVPQ